MQVQPQVATELRVRTQVNPGLLLLGRLLTLNATEIEQQIEQELQENPALEKVLEEPENKVTLTPTEDVQMKIFFSDSDASSERMIDHEDEETDRLDGAASFISLKEYLLSQLSLTLSESLHPIGEFLIESLDENGYLQVEPEEVALRFETDLETVYAVLQALQNCDPPGVGARSLQECLLLQIQSLKHDHEPPAPPQVLDDVEQILTRAWDDFAHGRASRVMRKLGLSNDRFESAASFVRQELVPYPGETFHPLPGVAGVSTGTAVEPDVIIRSSMAGFEIEIRGADPNAFAVNRFYVEQYRRIIRGETRLSKQEQDHVRQYVERAQMFLKGLYKRRCTIRRIVQFIVRTQHTFLLTGDIRFLQPITRSHLADEVGLHRSTIGRAVRNKFMQLPNGTVVPFAIFFKPAVRTALLIDQIIRENEGQSHRLTDAEIAHYLAEMGIQVSRRTVAKYRNQSNILSSRWR